MSPFLMPLLGAQMAPGLEYDEEGNLNAIVAEGARGQAAPASQPMAAQGPVGEQELLYYGNRPDLEAGQYAREEAEAFRKEYPRKGMFGIKGTLRDVIGALTDGFLVQSGNKPFYGPLRQQEMAADAMAGASRDRRAAAERLFAIGQPDMAAKLIEEADASDLRRLQTESLIENRENMQASRLAQMGDKFRIASANILNNPQAYGPDGVLTKQAYDVLVSQARAANTTPEQYGIVPGMTRELGSILASGNMPVVQQERLPIEKQRADAATSNARSAAIRADKAPSGRAPPRPTQPTEAAEIARIRDKLNRGETLSAGDKATWEKYTRPPRGRGGSGGGLLTGGNQPAAPAGNRRLGPPRN